MQFGPTFARNLRRLRPRPSRTWRLDDVVVSIQGRRMYPWQAVDSEGKVLNLLIQPKRDKQAAVKLIRKLLKKQGHAPDLPVTTSWAPPARAGPFRAMSRACVRTTGPRTPTKSGEP